MEPLTLDQFHKLETAGWLCALTVAVFMCGHVCLLFLVCVFIRSVFMSYKNKSLGPLSTDGRCVLITGCDSGFGLGLAERLHDRGFTVFATCYNLQSPGATHLQGKDSERMRVVPCDVSSDDSVAKCLRLVREQCGHTGLWGLVNNAGQNFIGDIELTTMSQYLEIANINLFGMVRMCKSFLPLLRQAKGRVVNVTSVKGLFAIPANAAYTVTKFGGEAFSDTLAQEMTQYGVGVVVVEPGNFGGITGCLDAQGLRKLQKFFDDQWQEASPEVKEFYGVGHLQQEMENAKKSASTTHPTIEPILDAMEDALRSQCPRPRYLVDGSSSYVDVYNWLAIIAPYIPHRFFVKIRAYFFPYIIYK